MHYAALNREALDAGVSGVNQTLPARL
jgi:hypothetical protein